MSFKANATNIRLEGSTLQASLPDASGNQANASVDLNGFIGNNNGPSLPRLRQLSIHFSTNQMYRDIWVGQLK